MTTSKRSMPPLSEVQWMLFPADHPANQLPLPGNREGTPIPDGYGPSTSGSSGSVLLDGWWQRMFQESVRSSLMELTGYEVNWKRKATPLGHSWWVLTTLAPRTGGSGCSSWPTARGHDHHGPQRSGTHGDPNLPAAVLSVQNTGTLNWPTATAGDANSSGSRNLEGSNAHPGTSLTPKAADGRSKGTGGSPDHGLDAMARAGLLWGTPTTRDWKDGACRDANVPTNGLLARQVTRVGPPDPESDSTIGKHRDWPTPAASTDNGGAHGLGGGSAANATLKEIGLPQMGTGRLNPDWVTQLMGFPDGWLDLPAETLSSLWATRSCRKSPK